MRMPKYLIAGLLAVFAVAGVALAQVPGLFIASPTGLEQINVLGTGPQIETVTLNQIRNAQGYIAVAAGTTISTTVPNTAAIAMATGAITTWNVTFPTAPYDGEVLKESCPGGNVGTVSNTATLPSGVTVVGAAYTSCSSTSPTDAAWIYSLSANIWYRTE